MSFLDILRKLGIVRFGVKTGTYTSAKDMPVEFLMNGVYNAEKELITKQEVKAAVAALKGAVAAPAGACSKCGAALKPDAKFCGACGTPCAQPLGSKCSACGAVVKPDARFCGACGAPVKSSVSAGKPAAKKGCLPLVLVMAGVLGIIVVFIVVGVAVDGKKDVKGAGDDIAAGSRAEVELPDIKLSGKQAAAAPSAVETHRKPETDERAGGQASAAPLKNWNPASGEEAAAGPAGLKFDKYVNRKFGFVAELPAHWESEVKDNAHVFCGPEGAEDYNTTINFQFITRKPGSSLKSEADEILAQWKTMDGFKLEKTEQGDLNGYKALYMIAGYNLPGGQAFRQMQAIIDREPFYYMIGYTAPQNLFAKYYFVMVRLIGSFQFVDIQK